MAEAFSNYYGTRTNSSESSDSQNSAIYVISNSDKEERRDAPGLLSSGKVNFIFTVDLYNEGVDIKDVNAVLFLRPTESMTIFVQQLGRGLRKAKGKSELTVLDFVGQANDKYKIFEKKLNYLSSAGSISIKDKIENGFVGLPLGCSIKLEKTAKEYVLNCINKQKSNAIKTLVKEYYNEYGKTPSISEFLKFSGKDLQSIYNSKEYTMTGLCSSLIKGIVLSSEEEKLFSKAFLKFSTIDSISWIKQIQKMLKTKEVGDSKDDKIYQSMFYYTFYSEIPEKTGYNSMKEFFMYIFDKADYCSELSEILKTRLDAIKFIEQDPELGYPCGLKVYCSYYRSQIMAGLGINNENERDYSREGVYYSETLNTDILLFDLVKSEKDFTPSTMYRDYAISGDKFHWQSQNKDWEGSKNGKRYINQKSRVILFARVRKQYNGKTMPYIFLGEGYYMSHRGNRPMSIIWKMKNELPAKVISNSPVGL